MLARLAHAAGHTLVEILAVLGLAALLGLIAVPAFSDWLQDSRRDAAAVAALHAVHLARQLAAVRGEAMQLCGSPEGLRCTGRTDWSEGLLLSNLDGSLRRAWPAARPPGRVRLHSNRAVIRFEGGSAFASPATITVCDRRGAMAGRALIISRSGRPRMDRVAGDGVPAC